MTMGYPVHPAADLFPMLGEADLAAMADDIAAHGQREAVVLWQGQILDGRNRLAACRHAGVEPRFHTLTECPDPVAFVLSANLHRRHLDASQRAMVAADALPLLSEQARARQVTAASATNSKLGRESSGETLSPNLGEASGKATDHAAKLANVGRGTVEAAAKVKRDGAPELADAVKAGAIPVSLAAQATRLPKEQQAELVTQGPKALRDAVKAAVKSREEKSAKPARSPHADLIDAITNAADLGALDKAYTAANLHRRHLDASQRAMVAARAKGLFEDEAAARRKAAQNNNAARAEVANLPPQGEPGKSREKAADMANVSARSTTRRTSQVTTRRCGSRGSSSLAAANPCCTPGWSAYPTPPAHVRRARLRPDGSDRAPTR